MATFAWMFAASMVVLLVIKAIMGLRVSEEEELEGMDVHECGMQAYPEFGPAHSSMGLGNGPGKADMESQGQGAMAFKQSAASTK